MRIQHSQSSSSFTTKGKLFSVLCIISLASPSIVHAAGTFRLVQMIWDYTRKSNQDSSLVAGRTHTMRNIGLSCFLGQCTVKQKSFTHFRLPKVIYIHFCKSSRTTLEWSLIFIGSWNMPTPETAVNTVIRAVAYVPFPVLSYFPNGATVSGGTSTCDGHMMSAKLITHRRIGRQLASLAIAVKCN